MAEPAEIWRTKSVKVDEAQASARSCAGRPDFLPCDGVQSACTTHSHGKCFKLHWCCLLGWCHCKYVYQPMTNVLQLPSTPVPSSPGDHTPSLSLSALLAERFLRTASCLASPTADRRLSANPSTEDYAVTRVNGRAFYIPFVRRPRAFLHASPTYPAEKARPPNSSVYPGSQSGLSNENAPLQGGTRAHREVSDQWLVGQKSRHGFSPSGMEDSGIPGVDRTGEGPELNEEPNEPLSTVLNEDLEEGFDRRDHSPLPVSGFPQDLAEALETTV